MPVPNLDGSERVAALRRALRTIESTLPEGDPGLEPGRDGRRMLSLGEGGLSLDARLGGGLAGAALHEVVAAHRADDGAAAGFAVALAARCAGDRPLVWIVEDCAATETGAPYRPGLAAHGLDPDRLVLVRTADARATLWACEEALRSRAPVVLAELWGAQHYGLAPSRRLLLAARAGRGIALLLHTGLSGKADALSSAADTRFAVAACPSPRLASAGARLPIPGIAAFAVRLLKLRAAAGFDRDRVHALVWNPVRRCFDDHPSSVGVSAAAADRPARTAGLAQRRAAAG